MRPEQNGIRPRIPSWTLGTVGICLLCSVTVPHMISVLYAQPSKPPQDPAYDLFECTRIEIKLAPSIIEYLGLDDKEKVLLTRDEQGHLKSLATIVCDNPEYIRRFAMNDLRRGRYVGPVRGEPRISNRIHIVGYKNDERVTSFTMIGATVHTEDGYEFEYGSSVRQYLHLVLSQVWPFALRSICADNLSSFRGFLTEAGANKAYPPPANWCDVVFARRQELSPETLHERSMFECPSAHTCHYAINPGCKPDSPKDTVLLFETKAGWNQHGGSELFTFDNHDPRGGCVLLNDGTVTFIRTEEELRRLRWQ